MSKKSLRSLVNDPRFIPGIYNYCDRWCERCRLSSRCLTFAKLQADGEPGSDEQLLQQVEGALEEAIDLVHEKADELGIQLSEAREPAEVVAEQATRELLHDHPLLEASRRYGEQARAWLKVHAPDEQRAGGLPAKGRMRGKAKDANLTRDQAIEVIERYLFFIPAKLFRALSMWGDAMAGRSDDGTPDETCAFDANGSARAALHAIEASLDAWFELMFYESDSGPLMRPLLALTAVREGIHHAFPRAHAFMRPGFDTGDQPWPEGAARSPARR